MPTDLPATPPFLRAYPPWFARTTGWLLAAVAGAAAIFAAAVPFPVAVEGRFTIVDAGACPPDAAGCDAVAEGELELPQSAFADLGPDQAIELQYDALPSARWGIRRGTLRRVEPAIDHGQLRVRFQTRRVSISTGGGARWLGAGATGTARIVLGQRTLLDRVLLPLRAPRTPPDEPTRESP